MGVRDLLQYTRYGRPLGYHTTSLEEDTILITDAAQDLSRVDNQLNEVQRLSDIATTLDDVVKIGSCIESASMNDLFMVETAARMALAGSDVPVTDLAPGLENYEGRKLSLEGIRSFIDGIWKVIVDSVKAVWRSVSDFYRKIFGTIPSMRRALAKIKAKAEDSTDDWNREAKLKLGVEIGKLVRDDKLPKFGGEIVEGLDILAQHVDFYLGEFTQSAADVYDRASDHMARFDADNVQESLNLISAEAIKLSATHIPGGMGLKPVKDPRMADGEYFSLPHLPGNRTMFVRKVNIPDETKPVDRASAIQQTTAQLRDSKSRLKIIKQDSGEIDTPSSADILQMVAIMTNICDRVEKYGRSKERESIDNAKETLLKVSDDLVSRSKQIEATDTALPYYRAAIKYNSFLTTAVVRPVSELVSLSLNVNRAAIVVCEKTLGIGFFN